MSAFSPSRSRGDPGRNRIGAARSHSYRTIAFTLIELLVVIGIIAVLISILMPMLTKARQHALRVKCASNLKQVAAAINMYVADGKGFLPIGKIKPCGEWTDGYFWFDHIDPYLHRTAVRVTAGERPVIWRCPVDDPRAITAAGDPWHHDPGETGYGYNVAPMQPGPFLLPGSFLVIDVNPHYSGQYVRLSRVPDQTARGMVGDSRGWMNNLSTAGWDPSQPVTFFQLQDMSPDRHAPLGQSASTNVLFFDSHVESLSALDAVIAFGNPARIGWSSGQ